MDTSKEAKYESSCKLIDDANMLALYVDTTGSISYCNKKVEAVTAKNREDIIGQNWLSLLYRGKNTVIKQQMFKAVMEDTISYKRPNNFQGVIIGPDNNERLICWSITPILSVSEELEGVLFTGNDITELKEREDFVRKIDNTLKNIFSNIKEYALYVTNLKGNITYYGMGSEVMFGWHKNEIIFKHVNLLHTPEDATSKLPSLLEQVRQQGKCELEIEMLKKAGQSFPVILNVSQFLDTEGKLNGYIFIAKDITERKKLEYQIFQAEKLTAMGQLVAGMAHEINNPLLVISGRLELLLGQDGLNERQRDELDTINAQTDRIRGLIDRFLRFSRKSQLNLENININEAIDNILPLLSCHKLHTSNVNIEKEFTKDLPPIAGDLNQLQEVIVNLLVNAYQAMPSGGVIRIKTTNLSNRFLEIRISDTGIGIAPENLKNIFMPFFSTKKDGTGLGLSICYNIIRSHSGSIDIETQAGKGTIFIIKLPFIQ